VRVSYQMSDSGICPGCGAARPPRGLIVWFTGLSGAGKSTLCSSVSAVLCSQNVPTEVLDADVMRQQLSGNLGFTKEDRDENVRRLGFVAHLLAKHGVVVLVAAMSPFRQTRAQVRDLANGRFLEIYVDAPLAVCEQRDVKGLYGRARKGLLSNFIGIDVPYEPPLEADLSVHTDSETITESTVRIVERIRQIL
jgi:adenylylsulfate kinase